MSIWILAILLLAAFAGIGYAKGGIRMAVSFVGLILGVILAVPFGHVLRPLMGTFGVANPVWLTIVPPVVAFLIIYLAAMGLSFFVHHKVYLIYKYKHDDVDRIRWERMNHHVGTALGLLSGAVLFLYICGLIYAAGYLTIQLSAEENNPGTIKFINSVRQDMAESGFDKAAAKFQPAPQVYYDAADVLGLLYHNPLLQSRLAKYPYFLSLGEKQEFQEMANDKEFNDLIFGKAPVTQIIENPRTQSLLGNAEFLNFIKSTDLEDLKEYLRTGKSKKYESQEILGVWELDKPAVLTYIRKSNPDIRTKELRLLQQAFATIPNVSLVVTPENKVIVRTSGAQAPAPAQPAEQQPVDPMVARYGPQYNRRPGAPAAVVTNKPPVQPELPVTIPKLSGEGEWKEDAGQYVIALKDDKGTELKGTAKIQGDEMLVNVGGVNLVFAKQ